MCVVPTEGRRELDPPGAGIAEGCTLLCRFWEQNRGSPARIIIPHNHGATSPTPIKSVLKMYVSHIALQNKET